MKRYIRSEKSLSASEAFFTASEEELRVLCLISASEEALSAEELWEAARLDALGDAKDALAFWRGAGLIKTVSKKKESVPTTDASDEKEKEKRPVRSADALPVYSGKELSSLIDKGNLASFIEACQQIYGKVLSSTDIGILVGLKEELRLDCEYICLLLEYYGEKAGKPMRYVEKVAFSLYDSGVTTFDALEAHIEKHRRMKTREGALRKLFGMGDRALTAKEEEAFTRWCVEYNYDDAIIGLAYDLTVDATGKASVAYADKIVSRWNTAGVSSVAEATALLEKERKEKSEKVKKNKPAEKEAEKDAMRSFEVDDFFAHALDRSYGKKDAK